MQGVFHLKFWKQLPLEINQCTFFYHTMNILYVCFLTYLIRMLEINLVEDNITASSHGFLFFPS